MRQFIFSLITIILSMAAFGQQQKIDSLKQELDSHKENDSTKVNILTNLAYYYYSVNAEKGIKAADQAIYLAKQLNLKSKLAKAYINKANNYVSLGKDTLALKLFHLAIKERKGGALYGIARVYQNRSEYETAIEYYKKAHAVFKFEEKKVNMAKMLNGIGVCYLYQRNYPKALEVFMEAQLFYEGENLTEELAYSSVLSNIGLVYNKMENKLQHAIEYHQKALHGFKKLNYKIGMANVFSNMANAYDNLNQPLKAIEQQEEAYGIYKDIGDKTGMANALTNIGITYTSIPDYDKAQYYLEQTLPIYTELGNKTNATIVKYYLGEVLLEQPTNNHNLTTAENYLKEAVEASNETGDLIMHAESLNALSKLFRKQGNYKTALEYKDAAIKIKDSLTSQDLKDEITRLEVKYEYDHKAEKTKLEFEKQQALAQAEIKRQKLIKNGSIFGGGLLLASAIFGLMVYKRKRDAIAKKQEAEFNTTVANTQLKALRAQMNPHFIFNSLNSINDYIAKNDAESASKYLTKFAKIMRQTLENSNQNDITLQDDLQLIELYMQIEAMRLNNKFSYNIAVDKSIDTENTLVPPLILQPFIENSIWHGISKKEGKGHIDIFVNKENNMMVCTIVDDGIGLNENKPATGKTSLGQTITKDRIDIINKVKNTKGSVTIKNNPTGKGVKVEVKLPLELAF